MNGDNSDHDLLIAISTDMRWVKDWAIAHEKSDAANNAVLQQSVGKAHKRVDDLARDTNNRFIALMVSGVGALILLLVSFWIKMGVPHA